MILKDLSKFIILDDVRLNAKLTELYFISHLLGNESLVVPDDWAGRIYTSQFIFDILCKKKPGIHPKHFKIMQPNVPIKLKSKEKTILVTMFETEELSRNVMFFFDDGTVTHLYTGVFTEIGSLFRNEQFMSYVQTGIDIVYIDTTRCYGKSYIFTEDVVEDIKQLFSSHPQSPLAVVVPHFGYEKLLVKLIKTFPQEIFPTKNQRNILGRLGFKSLLAKEPKSRIIVFPPGFTPDFIESNQIVAVYIVEGKTSVSGVCGMHLSQWSPLPSLMDLQALLDIIRPNLIIPIRRNSLQDIMPLPATLQWFTRKGKVDVEEGNSKGSESSGTVTENDSTCSFGSACSNAKRSEHVECSSASTKVFVAQVRCPEASMLLDPIQNNATNQDKATKPTNCLGSEEQAIDKVLVISCDLTKKRERIIRRQVDFEFDDSS